MNEGKYTPAGSLRRMTLLQILCLNSSHLALSRLTLHMILENHLVMSFF